jgi:hypothetical protein
MNSEDKALAIGAAAAGLTAAGGYLSGHPGTGELASIVILAIAAFLKAYLKAPAA